MDNESLFLYDKKRRNVLFLTGLFIVCFFVIGVSYAVWQMTFTQTDSNVVMTGCFKVEFTDQNPINLEDTFPVTDEEGKSFMPYEFTITNTCEDNARYQINLEILYTTTFTDLSFMKMSLNESSKNIKPSLLTVKDSTTKTLENARSAYKLEVGYLKANEAKTYHLRLWMDYDTPNDKTYMNKIFSSKVTVTTSYIDEIPKMPSEQNVEYIKSKATSEMIVEDDETPDHNLRYVGVNPNNYIDIGD